MRQDFASKKKKLKRRKAAPPTAPKTPKAAESHQVKEGGTNHGWCPFQDRQIFSSVEKCKSVQLDHELCFAILCTFLYIVTCLCYFHNIVASANCSSYLSIEARVDMFFFVWISSVWVWKLLGPRMVENYAREGAKSGETLMKAHNDTDGQIVRHTWV